MILETIKRFNWIDILAVIILFRIGYVSVKNGLKVEIFKLLGTLAAVYLSLHYYTTFSDSLAERIHLSKERMPLEFMDLLSFVSLSIIGYLIFVSIRAVFYRFLKMEATAKLNFWGGFILGIGRGILLIGLIIFILVISSIGYFKNSVINSYSGRYLFKIAPATYESLWNGLASKFMVGEKFNETIIEVQKDFATK